MNIKRIVLIVFSLLTFCLTALAHEEYKIYAGDNLGIKVLRYAEFDTETGYLVRTDGKITVPLLGDVLVKDMTPSELANTLAVQLKEYLVEPEVFVSVITEGTTRVYLLGEITNPGLYELNKSRTVLDAISAAGSWTSKTAKKRIYLIRKGKDEEPIKINLKKMLETGNMEQNYELNEGDVLYFKGNGKLF
ncbi:MAG: polysaccharide export protein [Phascolarctobacterium sp.]|nr:polysaccharide export protein [Phascolarctobacterium sp.]